MAIAASVIHGSATSTTGSRQRTWSQTKIPSQPASSASPAEARHERRVGERVEERQEQALSACGQRYGAYGSDGSWA